MIRILMSFVLIGLLFLSTLAYTFYQIQRPDFLVDRAKEVNLYDRLSSSAEKLIDPAKLKDSNIKKEDLIDVTKAGITPERFYDFLDKFLGSQLDWLTNRSSQINFHYDLQAAKHDAREKAIERMLANYDALPACQANQLQTWSFDNGLPSCKLPKSSIKATDIQRLVEKNVDETIKPIPDELTIDHPTSKMLATKQVVTRMLLLVKVIWLATLLFLLLFVLVLRRRAFLSLAVIFIFVGLIQVAFSLIAWDWLGRTIGDILAGGSQQSLAPVLINLVTAIIEVLKTTLGNLSIFFLSFGGVMLVLSFVFRQKPTVVAQRSTADTKS